MQFLPWFVFVQGIFLSFALLSKRKNRGNRYLGIFLILLSFHGLMALAWQNPDRISAIEIYVLFSCVPFLYGPLLYRYVWHSLYRDWKDRVPFPVHSLPAVINITAYSIFYLITGKQNFIAVSRLVFNGRSPLVIALVEGLKVIHGLFYVVLIILLIYRQRHGLKQWASVKERSRWLISLVFTFALNWILVLISTVLLWSRSFPDGLGLILSSIQLAAFILFLYTVSFFAIRYPCVLEPKEIREEIRKKLNLPPGFIDETLRRLALQKENKFYTDPDITLSSLADLLGLHANALSYIINEEEDCGFREYINSLRLKEFIRLARNPDTGRSQLDLAFEAGFSSKSTFLRVFRQIYGMTPRVYLETQGPDSHT